MSAVAVCSSGATSTCPSTVRDRFAVITDDFRIRAALPTIEWLTSRGASVVCASHLGRPKGAPDPAFSLEPVRERLAELAPGVELLENVRFNPGETSNDPAFVAELIDGIDATSTTRSGPRTAPTRRSLVLQLTCLRRWVFFCSVRWKCCSGLRDKPKHPFVAVLGGAKISDKLGVVDALLGVVDRLVIGGAMCFTFFRRSGQADRRLAL